MGKEGAQMQWFDHSSTAASDDAIMALRMEYPNSAVVDCYWGIVEKQFHDERSVPFSETNRETKALAHRLYVGFDLLSKYVETMLEVGLLKKDADGNLYSERAKEAIEKYQAKCETARQNGKKGGRKPKRKPTAKPTAEPTEEPSRPNTKHNNTSIGFDKQNQILEESSDAATAGAAPPDSSKVPACPECSKRLKFDPANISWECPSCGAVREPRYIQAEEVVA